MNRPRIVYQEILFHSWFARTDAVDVHNNKVFALPTDDDWLLAVLNSRLMWWFLTRFLPHMKDEALTPSGFRMEHARIVRPDAPTRRTAVELISRVTDSAASVMSRLEAETELSDLISGAYGLSNAEIKLLAETRAVRDPLDVQKKRLLAGESVAISEEASE